MHRTAIRVALGLAFAFAFAGCRSHEAKVADLQKQYDQLGDQFQKDCSGEMLNLPQKLSPKCADEKQKLNDAWNRLQAERAKK
jgi:hypothetical protein